MVPLLGFWNNMSGLFFFFMQERGLQPDTGENAGIATGLPCDGGAGETNTPAPGEHPDRILWLGGFTSG